MSFRKGKIMKIENLRTSILLSLAATALLVLTTGCATTDVHSGWDRKVDFSQYKTYAFSSDEEPNRAKAVFAMDVSRRLEEKGLTAAPENPDLLVYVWGIVSSDLQWGSVGVGYSPSGGWSNYYGYGWGGRGAVYIGLRNVAKGSAVVDLVDTTNNRLIWRSTAQKVINTDHRDIDKIKPRLESITRKMFNAFPPGAGS